MILMIVLILTDTAGLSNRHMNIKEKGVLTFLLLAIAGMIWSALYLDFTEVGRTTIAGVQGRYYLPLLFPLFSMFLPMKLRTLWNEQKYDLTVFAAVSYTHLDVYKRQIYCSAALLYPTRIICF